MGNFTAADLLSATKALPLLALFLLVPGFVLGWLADVLDFRRRTPAMQVAFSVPFSMAFCPILAYLLARWFSMKAVLGLYGVLWCLFPFVAAASFRRSRRAGLKVLAGRQLWVFLVIAVAWTALCTLLLIDLQIGDKLYFSVVSWDYAVRTAFTDAISRTGIPPVNPYGYLGLPASLRYHYFWLIPSSLADQLGGNAIDPRQAMLAATAWCGLGLFCIVVLYLALFEEKEEQDFRRRALLGVSLLAVTGLDLVPVWLHAGLERWVFPSMEWWNTMVMAWVHAVLLVPLYLAGLIVCLTGILILWRESQAQGKRRAVVAIAAAAVAFATALGTSIYVTFVCAAILGVWMLVAAVKRWRREVVMLVSAGLLALILSMPLLSDLRGDGAGGPLFEFAVRRFNGIDGILKTIGLPSGWQPLTDLLLLPLNYFMEFGFFFVVGCLRLRGYWRNRSLLSRGDLFALTMFLVTLLICSFLRSSVISNNDLGWRGILFVQFLLLLWAVDLVEQWKPGCVAPPERDWTHTSPRLKSFLRLLLLIGVAGSLYEVAAVRFFPMLSDTGLVRRYVYLATDTKLGKRAYALRQLYEKLDATLPPAAIVQHNPDIPDVDLFYGLYAHRQTAAQGTDCGATFGGDPRLCPPVFSRLKRLFGAGHSVEPAEVASACRDLSIDVLVVKDTDPVWPDKTSWVWKTQPLFENSFARAFACRN